MTKQIKGEKYTYLLMAYERAKKEKNKTSRVGDDNGMVGGQNFFRRFTITEYQGKTLLQEMRYSKSSADFSRYFEVKDYNNENSEVYILPSFYDYINESGENCAKRWEH